jgi:ABC-type Fe3+ transport system permease subunit
LLGVVGAAAVITLCVMFITAHAITLLSGPRRGPRWVEALGEEDTTDQPRGRIIRSGVVLGILAIAFELPFLYLVANPVYLPSGGSVVLMLQIAAALVWTAFYFRLPRQRRTTDA